MYRATLQIDGKTFECSHASAFECMEGTLKAYAADKGISNEDAGDELAYAEMKQLSNEALFLNGVQVDQADHL